MQNGKMRMMPSDTIQPYLERYGAIKTGLPGSRLPWLGELREAGLRRFAALGFPTPRVEAWKYTNLRSLESIRFTPAAADRPVNIDVLPTIMAAGGRANRVVLVDGRFRPDLSSCDALPEGASLAGLAATLDRDPGSVEAYLGRLVDLDQQPLAALNTAFLEDGLVLRLGRGVQVDAPIEIVYVGTAGGEPVIYHPRTLIIADENAEATIVEHHVGLGTGIAFANGVTEIFAGSGARLHHYKMQREGADAFHLSTTHLRLASDVTFDSFVLNIGARLARNEIRAILDGTGIDYRINGAYMVRGRQHSDITTVIDHARPGCSSHELVKGVIDDEARAVFQGKIVVREKAQKSDGYQLNRALLLSDTAEIDSKPELEIYADDVKCSHGATVGELDDDALFYLRARGIDLETARRLLIAAFLDDAVNQIPVEAVREAFKGTVAQWLQQR